MARVQPVDRRKAPLFLKLVNASARRSMGKEPEQMGIVAHNPRFLLPFLMTSQLISAKTRLDPRIRILATEVASHLNGCSWCIDYGGSVALRLGVPSAKLDDLLDYAVSPLFSPAERTAMAVAEAMTRDVHVSDEVWADARRYYSEREMVELVVAVAIETFYNRVNSALGIEAQGFCELPSLSTARHTVTA